MIRVRTYGTAGPWVFVLHGGPGAPGHMAGVARGLADLFRVIEPFQRGSGAEPLSVTRHIEDLHEQIGLRCGGERPALVGSSWGAMLALAYAAAHPDSAGPVVLIGCGTFDEASRARFEATIEERMDDELRRRLGRLAREVPDENERLKRKAEFLLPLYSCDLITTDLEMESCDARANRESWDAMLRLQGQGIYPAAFSAIRSPVLMLHGAMDPHPGRMILASLAPHVPHIEYREWERCGHYPWLERAVRDEFFALLRGWLAQHLAPDAGQKSQKLK